MQAIYHSWLLPDLLDNQGWDWSGVSGRFPSHFHKVALFVAFSIRWTVKLCWVFGSFLVFAYNTWNSFAFIRKSGCNPVFYLQKQDFYSYLRKETGARYKLSRLLRIVTHYKKNHHRYYYQLNKNPHLWLVEERATIDTAVSRRGVCMCKYFN